jgi:hypothetical protein
MTHLSIGRYGICSTLCWARCGCKNGWLFLHSFQPLRGPTATFSSTCQVYLPTQPLPCYPSSIDTASPAPDSSRASPRIAPLLLVHIVDKLRVLPRHSDSIPGVSVVNGFQLGSYASNSQGQSTSAQWKKSLTNKLCGIGECCPVMSCFIPPCLTMFRVHAQESASYTAQIHISLPTSAKFLCLSLHLRSVASVSDSLRLSLPG